MGEQNVGQDILNDNDLEQVSGGAIMHERDGIMVPDIRDGIMVPERDGVMIPDLRKQEQADKLRPQEQADKLAGNRS